ncbi:MAG: ACP S-malonyltransferase, partial [Anaerolineales bacterium]
AFVFPGQGSQSLGMGYDLATEFASANALFSKADALLEYPLSKICWEGPLDKLNDTQYTQPALFVHSIATLTVLKQKLLYFTPKFVAGHSMGEITALVAADVISFEDGLNLVQHRGRLMKKSGELNPGGMAAILGLDIKALEEICEQVSRTGNLVQVANDNCPGQIVISGTKSGINFAMEEAKKRGAKKTIPLAVSIAAHSPIMAPAKNEFKKIINGLTFRDAKIAIVGNVCHTAMISAEEIKYDIKEQLTSPVYWTDSIKYMIENGIENFIEIGNGTVLAGLIKRIDSSVNVISIGAPSDFTKLDAV